MKNHPPLNLPSGIERAKTIAEEIKYCMMTTLTPEGRLLSRPMTLLDVDESGLLYFFASKESEQTVALDIEDNVNLTFVSPADSRYLSICGSATVELDRDRVEKLWKPWAAAWFPLGKNDPLLCVIKVHPISAEYWEGPGKVIELLGMAKAILTHKRYDQNADHGRLI